jgi:hypothetical protein
VYQLELAGSCMHERAAAQLSRFERSEKCVLSGCAWQGLVLLGRDAFPGASGVADGLVADPELVVDPDGKTLHLFMSSEAIDNKGAPILYGVSHATSHDGVHWSASPANPVCPNAKPTFDCFMHPMQS